MEQSRPRSLAVSNISVPGDPPKPGRANNTMERVKNLVTGLERRFNEIASIADVIGHVAKHTKLLSFNATIEAARAGESGRGFAVVASEVRALADRTSEATSNINRMLSEIEKEIGSAVQSVETAETEALLQSGIRIASLEAARLQARFMRCATVVHSFKYTLHGLKKADKALSRRSIDAVMLEYLLQNPDVLALSCCMEPNMFDGRDAEFADTPGTDATGRYIPYWNRGSGKITLDPLQDYDKPGLNDWYELPRKAGHDVMMEPYDYPVNGRMVQITSLNSPLTLGGRFAGVVGVDYALEQLQREFQANRPFGVGALVLISNGGIYAAHPEIGRAHV